MSANRSTPTAYQLADREGNNNGIHYIANLIIPEIKNYYNYCITALGLRGSLWAALTVLPLVLTGYIGIWLFLSIVVLLGIAFPLSVILGEWSMEKFTLDTKYLQINGTWEHAEVWYGLAQSIALIAILVLS